MNEEDRIAGHAEADEGGPAGSQEKIVSPAAQRALAEAEERRRKAAAEEATKEVGGRDGPDPVRYGDWEKDGIISDF